MGTPTGGISNGERRPEGDDMRQSRWPRTNVDDPDDVWRIYTSCLPATGAGSD
jgi:hypothetical protein